MILPATKSTEQQALLWDAPLGNHGQVRTLLGDFAERLTAKMLRGKRYRTDSRAAYCPDVFALGAYFEVKAAGRTNQTFVYAGRLEKDRQFASEHKLFYVVWHHAADTRRASTHDELRCLFLATLKAVYVVPFSEIDAIAATIPAARLNSKYGHSDSNPVYGAGHRIPLSRIIQRQHLTIHFEPSRELFA